MTAVAWKEWFDRILQQPTKQEQYTATLLKTLHELLESAPFDWSLTGGTALQSHFDVARRRYSTDIEIVTTAQRATVEAWLAKRKEPFSEVNARILSARLTPDGQLFIIHDYPEKDLEAARPSRRAFDHYPLTRDPPPGRLTVSTLSRTFLTATKIYGLQQEGRGGERSKDANDLALALPDEDPAALRTSLDVYAKHRRSPHDSKEIVRRAGVWLRIFSTTGYAEFARWHRRMAPPGAKAPSMDELDRAAGKLERVHGAPIEPTPLEIRRRLLHALSIKQVADIAKAAGYQGKATRELEKMYDYVAANVIANIDGPPPSSAADLLAQLRRQVDLPA